MHTLHDLGRLLHTTMKELKCERCGDLFVQGYDEQELCGLCITEIACEEQAGDPEITESDEYDLKTCHTV